MAYLGLLLLWLCHSIYALPGLPIWTPEPDVIDSYDFTMNYTLEDARICSDPLYLGMGCRVTHCTDFMARLRELNVDRKFSADERGALIRQVWGLHHVDTAHQPCINSVLKKARDVGALRAFHTRPARCSAVQQVHPHCRAHDCESLLSGIREYNQLGLHSFRLVVVFNIWGREYLDSYDCLQASLEEAEAEGIYQVSTILGADSSTGRPINKLYVLF